MECWKKLPRSGLTKVFGGPGTFFQKGSWPPEAQKIKIKWKKLKIKKSAPFPESPITRAKSFLDDCFGDFFRLL
jgi:hypothetical protein